MFFGTNFYGWKLLADRDGHDFNLERAMVEAKRAGITAWEPSFRKVEEVQPVVEQAKQRDMGLYSAYIFGAFHEPDLAEQAISNALRIAEALRSSGIRTLIFNPDPLPESAPKTDQQLKTQTDAISELGKALRRAGSRLLYHTHAPEMVAEERELRYMLDNTHPSDVGFCLDAHWVYRGGKNSQQVLHKVISQYANRIELMHLRQSVDGVWSESIGDGDIDYPALAQHLEKCNVKAVLVLELCMEKGTPSELTGEEANRKAIEYLDPLFTNIAVDPHGSAGRLEWQWIPQAKPGVKNVDEYLGSTGNGVLQKPQFSVTHFTDADGKVEKTVEEFPAPGWDDVFSRPLISFAEEISGADSVIPSEERIEFIRVVSGILRCASEKKAVDIRLKP